MYYDGTRLLSMQDLNGQQPELYICTSNRSAGKTTFFAHKCVDDFLKKGKKFALLYRFIYELDDCTDKFFKDIRELFFPDNELVAKRKASGIYYELFLDNQSCGYAIALNAADQLKKYSHFFSDVEQIMFDEFQSETNHYCSNEIKKFLSVFTSIARGKGKQHRYVPVYMISNPVSLVNPYYLELGISSRLRKDTKFLKGKGFVLEQGFNASAKAAQEGSPLLQAFSDSDYVDYAAQGVYLNDNYAFIEKPTGSGSYICTLRSDGKDYAIRAYESEGIVYCDMRVDPSFPLKIAISEADHSPNYVTLHYNTQMLRSLLWFWDKGCFRFKDINCKNAILKALSII